MPVDTKDPIGSIMREHRRGKLHSGKGGPVVKKKSQALAIAFNVARKSKN